MSNETEELIGRRLGIASSRLCQALDELYVVEQMLGAPKCSGGRIDVLRALGSEIRQARAGIEMQRNPGENT